MILAGKYRVDRVLAAGGQGTVIKAIHLRLKQPVAIKVPHRSADADDVNFERMFREARATFLLRSEHIARIIDVEEVNGAPFIVMEYLEGVDLKQMLAQRGPLPWEEAVGLLLQTLDGLAEAHDKEIVHRDLKPSNLFVERRPDGTPLLKVLDFGVSKTTCVALTDEQIADLTAPLRMVGTPRYVAPEQARDARAATRASDIWALGVIFQEMLTAEPVFRGRTDLEVVAQILHKWPAPISLVRADIPLEIERLILRCLQKVPEHRFADVRELAEHLAPFAPPWASLNVDRLRRSSRTSRPPAPAPSLPSAARPADSTRSPPLRMLVAGLAVGLLAGTAIVAVVAMNKNHGRRTAQSDPADVASLAGGATLEPRETSAALVESLDEKREAPVQPASEAARPSGADRATEVSLASPRPTETPIRRSPTRALHGHPPRRTHIAATGRQRVARIPSATPISLASSTSARSVPAPSPPIAPPATEKAEEIVVLQAPVAEPRRPQVPSEETDPLDGRR
jgi:serine/threonine protein kinase